MEISEQQIRATLETINRQSNAIAAWGELATRLKAAMLEIERWAAGAEPPKNSKLPTDREERLAQILRVANNALGVK